MNYIVMIQTIIAVIRVVEKLMPDSQGKDKLDAALVITTEIVGDITPIIPQVVALITAIVTGLRATGEFKTK